MTIEDYLKSLEAFVDDAYGRQIRQQFQSLDGQSELAMLQSPSREEFDQLQRAVAIMTPAEKAAAAALTDDQVARLADDAGADKALVAIFINGYAIATSKGSR